MAGPICLAQDGEAGAGECYQFASGSTDIFSNQALSYQHNLIGPWMLDSVAKEYGLTGGFLDPMFYDDIVDANVEIFTFSLLLQNWESLNLLNQDQVIVAFSLGFVYLWLFVHLQSFWLASVAISQIFLSIPASIFPYAFVFQVKYMGLMQYLTVFIILGVGADDVFVLADAWKQSKAAVPDQGSEEATLVMRLKYAIVRATLAVFNTSFTTAVKHAHAAACAHRAPLPSPLPPPLAPIPFPSPQRRFLGENCSGTSLVLLLPHKVCDTPPAAAATYAHTHPPSPPLLDFVSCTFLGRVLRYGHLAHHAHRHLWHLLCGGHLNELPLRPDPHPGRHHRQRVRAHGPRHLLLRPHLRLLLLPGLLPRLLLRQGAPPSLSNHT